MKGDVFTGIEKGMLPGQLRFDGFTPKDPSKEVEVTYKAAKDIELGQLRLDSKDRLLFVPAPGERRMRHDTQGGVIESERDVQPSERSGRW